MTLNPESKYPTRRSYVLKLRGSATAEALAGRLENLVTGRQREFASAGELLQSIAGDLELDAAERSVGGPAESEPSGDRPHGDQTSTQR